MIGLGDLRKKALRPWTDGRFLRAWLVGATLFPLEVPLAPPSGRAISQNFPDVRRWVQEIETAGKEKTGTGYRVVYRPVNHRQLGPQQMPCQVRFESRGDWLGYIGKDRDFKRFKAMVDSTRSDLPALVSFIEEKPMLALAQTENWDKLLAVCNWFTAHPRPDRYIRALDIPGVDTKFIEGNKKILSELLDRVLDEGAVDVSASGLAGHGFERRFGLKYDAPGVRFRLLDPDLAVNGLTDLNLPAKDFGMRDFGVETVFITENKINGLSFPSVPGAMVVFGLGYGIEVLFGIGWLRQKRIIYWGDIDTHGFAMLSRVRGCFQQTQSLLMDRDTLEAHRDLWGKEAEKKRFLGRLAHLSEAEQPFFADLKADHFGPAVRLEQERIRFSRLLAALREMGFNEISGYRGHP
jgi:hypothetical protein